MMLRDNLKTLEYFEKKITLINQFIQEMKDEIIFLKKEIKNGIKRYPKDNENIIRETYQDSTMYEMRKIRAMYSAGMSIENLIEDFEYTIFCMENYVEIKDYAKEEYLYILWMISLGILLETDKENMERLANIVEIRGFEDFVIDYLLCASDIGWKRLSNIYYKESPYSKVKEIIEVAQQDKNEASKIMKQYMENEWLRGHYDCGWRNAHKSYGYVGLWSFETAAIAKILELNDTDLKENNHYPYDLAHYKNTMKFKHINLDDYKCNNKKIENNPSLEKIITKSRIHL
ncbi:PoNe immunity protein domain-containing protein [Defluviitalea phaphyphila]|uniref:PoNe immunity protein domain-containing protein n=1 Tax=Defluviitalea phaphyphila TaxID=1473580 RepID=UPI000A06578D|nr:PoNe immunity protein domain-containing protein [Defluviitalea phaphyphila]